MENNTNDNQNNINEVNNNYNDNNQSNNFNNANNNYYNNAPQNSNNGMNNNFCNTEQQINNESKDARRNKIIILCIIILVLLFVIIMMYIEYRRAEEMMEDANLKPIIYLYPTEETKVNVVLENSDKITSSYPKYSAGWNVEAKPNGDLKDLDTGRNLYALYYESENIYNYKVEKEGFVVKGEDTAEFLEDKLKLLGLTDREAEEFIVYWLPKLEANKYNYIRFATQEEIERNMPLKITPTPDTTIRILMTYKGLENPIEVEEQEIVTPEREGFVAVEWGGTEITE